MSIICSKTAFTADDGYCLCVRNIQLKIFIFVSPSIKRFHPYFELLYFQKWIWLPRSGILYYFSSMCLFLCCVFRILCYFCSCCSCLFLFLFLSLFYAPSFSKLSIFVCLCHDLISCSNFFNLLLIFGLFLYLNVIGGEISTYIEEIIA